MTIYKNFKCEDCDNDKFTIKDNFDGEIDITLYCANKNCEASYTFRPVMKQSMSSHPPKRCSCGFGLLSRLDKYCSCCGKKNPSFKFLEKSPKKPKKKSVERRKTSSRRIKR